MRLYIDYAQYPPEREISITGKFRSSHQRCSIKKGVLRNFTEFTAKHLCQSLFFNKVAGRMSATLLKKRLWHRCFPVNFVKFLRTPFLQNTFGRLLFKLTHFRSIRSHMFFKIGVLKNFANYRGKHLCLSLVLIISTAT